MPRSRHTLAHVLGYHGCDASLGEAVLAGKKKLKASQQDYDWLGHGIYFWLDSPERAWNWATHHPRPAKIRKPFVLGALIYPGLCLNLTDYGVLEQLRAAHQVVLSVHPPNALPQNTTLRDGTPMLRRLDCAVIETLHRVRAIENEQPYDSVYGVFSEGREAYPGAGFLEKTHIQLAVRNPETIVGYFRVDTRSFTTGSSARRKMTP